MRCLRCGKSIGLFRRLSDVEFCCADHRSKGARASAARLRDLDGDELGEYTAPKQAQRSGGGALPGVVMLLAATALLAARIWFPGESGTARVRAPAAESAAALPEKSAHGPVAPPSTLFDWAEEHLPGGRPLRLREEFNVGGESWVRYGGLRLWEPTLAKADYDFLFQGSIERKGLGWAFRASGPDNYYALKVLLLKPGVISGASIRRTVIRGGRVESRHELPLPVVILAGRTYRFSVSAEGSRFVTRMDGHVIDEWTDLRLARGGVGFVSEIGEMASIQRVEFYERRGWLSSFNPAAVLMAHGGIR